MNSDISFVDPGDLWDKDIFELMGLQNAPEDQKKDILENMSATINNRVLARALDQLDEQELREYQDLLDAQDDQKIINYLKGKNIDLVQYAAEEAMIYKMQILNLAKNKFATQEG